MYFAFNNKKSLYLGNEKTLKMIQELINFTKNIDEPFKTIGSLPKEGLHIRLHTTSIDNTVQIDIQDYQFEMFPKKQKSEVSDFLNECKQLHQNAWCLNTNKCFDSEERAIHTCSPFCVGFKREHLEGGAKFEKKSEKKKSKIYDRFNLYFLKAFNLFENPKDIYRFEVFKLFFTEKTFLKVLKHIENINTEKRIALQKEIDSEKVSQKATKDPIEKEIKKNKILELKQSLIGCRKLNNSDYIIFYIDVPKDDYVAVYKKYLKENLFNTDKYNTAPNDKGIVFGTSNFKNSFNSKMPFLIHKTATFDISQRISYEDALVLNDFQNMLTNKILPNPLPIFIYKDELQKKMISFFKETGFTATYREIVEDLLNRQEDLENYYLLYRVTTKDGIIFKDFDFVSKFEYKLQAKIENLFEIKEKGSQNLKLYSSINNIFEFEQTVFKQLLQNKYMQLHYFKELDKKDYNGRNRTFNTYSKFRKAVYDFVYRSQRQSVDGPMFDEMVFNGIHDDIKQNNSYGIKEKLNIWYSLYHYFNHKKDINMASNLKSYQTFVSDLTEQKADIDKASDREFAFAAGQLIYYIIRKSRSDDKSFILLEPYLQKSKCSELKMAISNDFARYKHENFSRNFERVASFVLSYETNANMKELLPELLSGIFATNQLFSTSK